MNKRDAINEILLALNELPLDTEDLVEDIPTAVVVEKELDIARKKVLEQGWNCNTITTVLSPNIDNKITVPQSYFTVKSSDGEYRLKVRDWKLYNSESNTFVFTSPVEVEVVEDLNFDDIPFYIANYIVQLASVRAYIDIIGNSQDVQLRLKDLNEARVSALRNDANESSDNVFEDDNFFLTTNVR